MTYAKLNYGVQSKRYVNSIACTWKFLFECMQHHSGAQEHTWIVNRMLLGSLQIISCAAVHVHVQNFH